MRRHRLQRILIFFVAVILNESGKLFSDSVRKVMGHLALPITSSLRMHAAAWSSGHPCGVRNSGTSATHWSIAYGQRGANRQPGGGFIRFGGDPAIGVRRSPGSLSLGIELSNPSV